MDIRANITRFLTGSPDLDGRSPDTRDASFDYCFNYFQSFREQGDLSALATPEHVQMSCLQLGFYLASWGMYRGSTQLIKKSARHLVAVVKEIAKADSTLWDIDLDTYTEDNIKLLQEAASGIRRANGGMTDTLVTKIMLGVFGNVPAFDQNFKRGFKPGTFGPTSLSKIGAFYKENVSDIDQCIVHTLDFLTGRPTSRIYTKAKVLDMAFFVAGMQ